MLFPSLFAIYCLHVLYFLQLCLHCLQTFGKQNEQMHLFANMMKDVFNLVGNMGNKQMSSQYLRVERRHGRTDCKSADVTMPYQLSSNQIKKVSQLISFIHFPSEVGRLINPFEDSFIKCSEWIHLCGELGVYLLQDMGVEHLSVVQLLVGCLARMLCV